ncbi:MAG: DEAD/DEAH box helicase [Chlorobi bacterium]|nr:DEAD/DEAH box helicase [Chlorobiota bacterium]
MITFEETGISPELLKAVEELGYEAPTAIQEKVIPHLLSNDNDLVAFAQTGTGKTAAFGLPLIMQTDIKSSKTQSLILCPTRELCIQITRDIESFSKFTKGFRVVPVYGGTSIDKQIGDLKKGAHAVVGTPGRVLDLLNRKKLSFANIEYLVLDEADEMLSMGFKDDLDAILKDSPKEKQTLLFSATMPKEIERIAKQFMTNPVEISSGKRNAGAENVNHIFYMVHARDRYLALKRIADIHPKIYGIVFCRTRRETKDVADKLMQDGYNADALHGDLSQAQRDHVMNRFRNKVLQILVATDVAARGLDVTDLTHIINYNPPDDNEVYIHRSGRTGRAGKKGTSISIIHTREMNKIKALEKITGKKFTKENVPTGKEICEKQLFNLVDKVEKIKVDESQIEQFLPVIYKKLDWLSREELIQHFVSAEFNRFLDYYKNAPDINASTSRSDDRERKGDRKNRNGDRERRGEKGRGSRSSTEFSRFFINVGKTKKLTVPRLIGLINDNTQKRNIEIGKVELLKNFSFFEVDSNYETEILQAFQNASFDGVKLSVEKSKPKRDGEQKDEFSSSRFKKAKKGRKGKKY